MVDEQTIVETSDEKRKRLQRERTQRYRDKNSTPEPPESFEGISALWQKNEEKLQKENPVLHLQIVARHKEVEELEAEADEIRKGVERGLRAETRSALTSDPSKIFPMPDLSFRDLRAHALMNGTANYRAIEADAIKGNPLDEISDYYRRYGFRLRIQSDTLQTAREMLILYAVRSKDSNIDWTIVNEAIDQHLAYSGFSPNSDELKRLIQENRSPKAPVAEAPMPIS
jgi:hypothetical protein